MARPGLTTHRKFRRLAKTLNSAITARGVLELLWDHCYEAGNDYLGTWEDIEAIVGWAGDRGALTRALVEVGLPEGAGFIEPIEAPQAASGVESPIRYRVHDLWQHAPEYVANRRVREDERKIAKTCAQCGHPFYASDPRSQYCSGACRTGGWRDRKIRHSDVTVTDGDVTGTDSDVSLAPNTQHPTPSTVHQLESAAPPAGDAPSLLSPPPRMPSLLVFNTTGKGPKTWELTTALVDEWTQAYPGLDIVAECRKAKAWAEANGLKTSKGMPAYLVNWFNRSVSRGGNRTGGPVTAPLARGLAGVAQRNRETLERAERGR